MTKLRNTKHISRFISLKIVSSTKTSRLRILSTFAGRQDPGSETKTPKFSRLRNPRRTTVLKNQEFKEKGRALFMPAEEEK